MSSISSKCMHRTSSSSSSYGQNFCCMPTSVLVKGAVNPLNVNGCTHPNKVNSQSSNEPSQNNHQLNGGKANIQPLISSLQPNCIFINGKYVSPAETKNSSSYGAGPQNPAMAIKNVMFRSVQKNGDSNPMPISTLQLQPIQFSMSYPLIQQNDVQQPQFCASTQPSTSNSINNSHLQSGVFNPYAMTTTQSVYGEPIRKSIADTNRILKKSSLRTASPCYSSSSSSYTTSPSKYTQHDFNLGFKKAPVVFATDNTPMTLFFTKTYCFSNHFPCDKLVIDGIKYLCTEQYYMYYKAHLFGDKHSALAVMSTADPKLMKRIGAAVLNFDKDQWFPVSIQVMAIASQRKYEQNADLRRQLFSTADTLLVEASPTDDRWGIGIPMDSMLVRDKKHWRGHNIMGRLLTMLRDRLLQKPEFAAEREELLGSCHFGEFRQHK